MSHEVKDTSKRAYRKRRRAELEGETRRRITEAAVDLHGTVGPAQTSISAIAERAGVQRATVYRHFPTEVELFAACSGHWRVTHPPPDFTHWAELVDPDERLRVALGELYAWYRPNQRMLSNVRRDVDLVAAMKGPAERTAQLYEGMAAALRRGRGPRGRRRGVQAAIGHALAFETWRSLTQQGLSDLEAAELMTALVKSQV